MSDFILRFTATVLDALIDLVSISGFIGAVLIGAAILCGVA